VTGDDTFQGRDAMNKLDHSVTATRFAGQPAARAFTLIEMSVVLAIISLLALISLPSISQMWTDNKLANIETTMGGLLKSARMRSLSGREYGLFFFVQGDLQKVAFIVADPPDLTVPANVDFPPNPDLGRRGDGRTAGNDDEVTAQDTADRFRVLGDNVFTIPVPFRVTPVDVLEEPDDGGKWSDEQLANEVYDSSEVVRGRLKGARNHRSFFTILFSPEGRLLSGRSVLLHDPADTAVDSGFTGLGLVTGLPVEEASKYQLPDTGSGLPTKPFSSSRVKLPSMLSATGRRGGGGVALNFPSVDGLLVYDDSFFRDLPDGPVTPPDEDKRDFLRRTGRPFYVSAQTGVVIRGPVGNKDF